ncbi:MAG: LysR family transcriptional regulator [Nocardioidaceae bacterium]
MGRLPDLPSLRLLSVVAEVGSLGQAARFEGISQPAASKRMAMLERTLGLRLLVRTPRGSNLTAEGQVIADWAARVIETVEQLRRAAACLHDGSGTTLRVAASITTAEHLVPTWLSELRASEPDLPVGLRVANSREVQDLVLSGEADIGFVESPTVDRRLSWRCVAVDELTVVVARGHSWAHRREPLPQNTLATTSLVVRELGSGTRETLESLLSGSGRAEPLLELGSNAAVKGAVVAGVGPAVLSRRAVLTELETGTLAEVRVADLDLVRRMRAVWPGWRALHGSSASLLDTALRGRAHHSGIGDSQCPDSP